MMKAPPDLTFLDRLLFAFRDRAYDGWTPTTRTEINRRFLSNRRGGLKTRVFNLVLLPALVRRGLCREVRVKGRAPVLEFRAMNADEIRTRLTEIRGAEAQLTAHYKDPARAEYGNYEVFALIHRLRAEEDLLRADYVARFDEGMAKYAPPPRLVRG